MKIKNFYTANQESQKTIYGTGEYFLQIMYLIRD